MKPLKSIRTQQTAGFSLIEVLVVIIMVGILAAIAAPSWLNYLNRQRVNAVETDLVQAIRSAQQNAIQERTTLQLQVTEEVPDPPSPSDPTATVPILNVGGAPFQLGESDSLKPGMIDLDIYTVDGAGTQTADDEFSFDYQGLVATDPAQELPFVISITATANSDIRTCVVVATLLGSLKTAEGSECDNPAL
ncbi:MAG: type II secretion system protein [Cyanobacteria bacterium J06638_20]